MLITSHLAVTLLVGKGLSLPTPELWVALLAGVLIDIDHLFVSNKWISDIRNFFNKREITHGEINQHSWLQEPVFGLIFGLVLGVVISFIFSGVRWWTFSLFQVIHIAMDSVMKYEHRPLYPASRWSYKGFIKSNTTIELILSIVFLVVVLSLYI